MPWTGAWILTYGYDFRFSFSSQFISKENEGTHLPQPRRSAHQRRKLKLIIIAEDWSSPNHICCPQPWRHCCEKRRSYNSYIIIKVANVLKGSYPLKHGDRFALWTPQNNKTFDKWYSFFFLGLLIKVTMTSHGAKKLIDVGSVVFSLCNHLSDIKAHLAYFYVEAIGAEAWVDNFTVPLKLNYSRKTSFTRRQKALEQIHRFKCDIISKKNEATPLVIHGTGGVGKTQLFQEYAYSHARTLSFIMLISGYLVPNLYFFVYDR